MSEVSNVTQERVDAFFNACEQRNAETARKILKELIDDGYDVSGYRKNIKNVYQSDTDAGIDQGLTLLHIAAAKSDPAVAEILTKAGCDVNARDGYGETPLCRAVCYNQDYNKYDDRIEMAKKLIKLGADPNIQNNRGWTPLTIASGFPLDDIIGGTRRHVAVYGGYLYRYCNRYLADDGDFAESVTMTQVLIDSGADVNRADNEGNTPLHYAVSLDKFGLQITEKLLQAGASVNVRNKAGRTPVIEACIHRRGWRRGPRGFSRISRENFDAILKMMIKAKADLNISDSDGKTALAYLAANELNLGWVRTLLKAGAKADIRDNKGNTILHMIYAEVINGPKEDGNREQKSGFKIAELLMDAGVDLDAENNDGKTPPECIKTWGLHTKDWTPYIPLS